MNNVGSKVLDFYKVLPFNQHSTVTSQIKSIKRHNPLNHYQVLTPLLKEYTSVLEVGSGTGWLSNSISHYYDSSVTAIDFNPRAIEFSQQVAKALALEKHPDNKSTAEFILGDLFNYTPAQPFDLVVSLVCYIIPVTA